MRTSPRIFLSSVFTDPGILPFSAREYIKDMTGGEKRLPGERPLWVAEDFRALDPDNDALEPLEKALFCVEGVRSCEYFLAILSHRHGSDVSIGVHGDAFDVPTTYFELELLAAALFEKPAHIFIHRGFQPSERLARFLEIVRPMFPGLAVERLSEYEILHRVERLVKRATSGHGRRSLSVPRKRPFIDTLFALRHRPYDIRTAPPPIRFLDGRSDRTVSPERAMLVPSLIERAHSETNRERQLVLLWFAIHSLMGVPYRDPRYRDYVALWEEALGMWAGTSAWYGLHGHAAMAQLAAVSSLTDARLTVAAPNDPSHGIPHGAIASAYHGIATHASNRDIAKLALNHLEVILATEPANRINLLSIRGSVLWQLGRRTESLGDHVAVAEARRGERPGVFGEGLSDLGNALVGMNRLKDGIAALECGVDLLIRDPRPDFDISAMSKLARGYARAGSFSNALKYALLARNTAVQRGSAGAVHRLERFIDTVDRLRVGRFSRRSQRDGR